MGILSSLRSHSKTAHPNPIPSPDWILQTLTPSGAGLTSLLPGQVRSTGQSLLSAWPLLNKQLLALASPPTAFRFSPGDSFPHSALSKALLSLHLWILSKAASFPFSGGAAAIPHLLPIQPLGRESRLTLCSWGQQPHHIQLSKRKGPAQQHQCKSTWHGQEGKTAASIFCQHSANKVKLHSSRRLFQIWFMKSIKLLQKPLISF